MHDVVNTRKYLWDIVLFCWTKGCCKICCYVLASHNILCCLCVCLNMLLLQYVFHLQIILMLSLQVTRTYDMPEPQKLEFLREIGMSHMRISEGLNSQLQLQGCLARLCKLHKYWCESYKYYYMIMDLSSARIVWLARLANS